MTSREKVRNVFDRVSPEAVMWTGHPNEKTIPIFAKAYGVEPKAEAIFQYLGDDCRWIPADRGYRHPQGAPMFDPAWGTERKTLSAEGCFAHIEDWKELDDYPWPNPDYLDFTEIYEEIDRHQDKMVFTGVWSPFFHDLTNFLGMENCFIMCYEEPELVKEITRRIVDFYVEANDRFFQGLGDRADVMFFGNDFGSQQDLLVSPELFREFFLPSIRRLIAVGKKYGKKVMLHSCGSIYRVLPDLIEAGVEILHPIQAQARGMSARELTAYKDKLIFVGGIDAQTFFVNATPEEIRREVARVRSLLGPGLVVSPSHEEILPNVPPQNILAMAQAAHTKEELV